MITANPERDSNEPKAKHRRKPLTAWELPELLTPVHEYRRAKRRHAVERPHYTKILAFVHRNRFALASQIRRRFADVLKSDRTTRRHLEEMEALGCLGVAPARGVSPLFPKVFYVTGRGVRRLREALAAQGKSWEATRVDRRGRHAREGYGAEHLIHELLITEFLLDVWQDGQERPDFEVLTMQRRSLVKHRAFRIVSVGRSKRLIPDAMFLVRHNTGGMACYFLEVDTGTMNQKQLRAKFQRYAAWANSHAGQQFLVDLYRRHGAANPRPLFWLLVVAKDRTVADERGRQAEFKKIVESQPEALRKRVWLTTTARVRTRKDSDKVLAPSIWSFEAKRCP